MTKMTFVATFIKLSAEIFIFTLLDAQYHPNHRDLDARTHKPRLCLSSRALKLIHVHKKTQTMLFYPHASNSVPHRPKRVGSCNNENRNETTSALTPTPRASEAVEPLAQRLLSSSAFALSGPNLQHTSKSRPDPAICAPRTSVTLRDCCLYLCD